MKQFNENEWYTLQEVADILDPPLTTEGVRRRLKKPGAPESCIWRGKWRINRSAFASCDWKRQ